MHSADRRFFGTVFQRQLEEGDNTSDMTAEEGRRDMLRPVLAQGWSVLPTLLPVGPNDAWNLGRGSVVCRKRSQPNMHQLD